MNYRYAGLIGVFLLAVSVPAIMISEYDRDRPAQPRQASLLPTTFARTPRRVPPDLGAYLSIRTDSVQTRKAIAAIRAATALAERERYEGALQEYDRAIELLPSLGDWLHVFSAGVAATAGDTAQVHERLAGLDPALLEEWAWRARLRAYRNANDRAGALQIARQASSTGSARRRAEGWRAIGELELLRQDSAAARSAFGNAIRAWPYSDVALDAARLLGDLAGLSADEQLAIGRIYLRFGNSKRGLDGLTSYLSSPAADPDTMMRVRFEIGRAHFEAGKYSDAERMLNLVTSNNALGAEARFLAARAAYRAGRTEEGKQRFAEVVGRFPGSDAATRALFMLGDLEHDAQNVSAAQAWFRRTVQAGGTSENAGVAHMRLVTIALSQRDTAAAVEQLESYRRTFSAGARAQQSAYWLGKLNGSTADLRSAVNANSFSWYGFKANQLLSDGDAPEFGASPVTEAGLQRTVEAAVERLDVLYELGWPEAAAFELRRVRDYFAEQPTALLSLAELLIERERLSAGIGIGQELLRAESGVPSRRLMRVLYPLPHRALIVREARRYDIDPYFMAALIRQESAFNPRATSSAGAMGLMQVMPSTGRVLARSMGIRRFNTAMLHDPATNVRIGARFLSDMIRTWGDRPDYVLAAYNAGPSRMARWRRLPEARDPDLFLERIPFDETRDYVRVVQLNTRIYELLYSAEEVSGAAQK